MSLMQILKDDQLAARKARETVKASLLTTLIGEAAVIGKNDGNRDTTDAEVVAVVKKFIKSNVELYSSAKNIWDSPVLDAIIEEKSILDSYLPKQLTKEDLKIIFRKYSFYDCTQASVPNKGQFMKHLKDNYVGQYDGKVAAEAVDEYLKG